MHGLDAELIKSFRELGQPPMPSSRQRERIGLCARSYGSGRGGKNHI